MSTPDLLGAILDGAGPPGAPPAPGADSFALLYRPMSDSDHVDVVRGSAGVAASIADLPLGSGVAGEARHELLAVLPYRQIRERGLAAPDDGAPLVTLAVSDQELVPLDQVRHRLPAAAVVLEDAGFDRDDDEFAGAVRAVVEQEIGTGEGANFVVRRSYGATVADWSPRTALSAFRRLLDATSGTHWTFLVHTPGLTLLGATPERHVTLADGLATMNPISGTYRHPAEGPRLDEVLDFLDDVKEVDELSMVLDEELKMMSSICHDGPRALGPRLKQMSRVTHTEYYIEGETRRDPREVLRETLLAPTVVGGPLASACRVVARREPEGRGYYAGVIALFGRDARGGSLLDSSILIRTATVDPAGRLALGVGATVVRGSDPDGEARETRAKAAGLLEALAGPVRPSGAGAARPVVTDLAEHPVVRDRLAHRNDHLAPFWFTAPATRRRVDPHLAGTRVLVVDAEDAFSQMIRHHVDALGCATTVVAHDEPLPVEDADVVVLGPGPGDPRDESDPKIATLRDLARRVLATGVPTVGVCLGHQVLSSVLGLRLAPVPVPVQGTQRTVSLAGRDHRVGFYNTFAAHHGADRFPGPHGPLTLDRDPATGEVRRMRGARLSTCQFHPESILSLDGQALLAGMVREAVIGARDGVSSVADERPVAA